MTKDISTAVSKLYEERKVVRPPQLQSGLFTTAAVDNIDHNPSSNTSQKSFHGTGITLFQHPDANLETVSTCPIRIGEHVTKRTAAHLPLWYTNVPPYASQT